MMVLYFGPCVKFGVACCAPGTPKPWGWGLAHLLQCSHLQSAFAMAAGLELPGADGAVSWWWQREVEIMVIYNLNV